LFSVPDTKNNGNLKPEMTISREIGLEMSFLNNRFGFDASYYHTNTVDQIPVAVSLATGYSVSSLMRVISRINVELSLFGAPIGNRNFSWNVNVNFLEIEIRYSHCMKTVQIYNWLHFKEVLV
jgi:outer membrane receptor protein involved in Fe transport